MAPLRESGSRPILQVQGLTVCFPAEPQALNVVDDMSFAIGRGETLALVGESGSGKSITALSIMQLLPPTGRITNGSIAFDQGDADAREIVGMPESEMQRLRGNKIGMIFQEPMTSLNPVFTIGNQIMEPLRIHLGLDHNAARRRAIGLLDQVGIAEPSRRIDDYPHRLSGGMRQRAMIAIALSCEPSLLIADEPTTALDVTIQAQILYLLKSLREKIGMSVLFITHDLGVVAEIADRVVVMYSGRAVEQAETEPLFRAPRHPYTKGLLASIPGNQQLDMSGDGLLPAIRGSIPDAANMSGGCAFQPRCDFAIAQCGAAVPPMTEVQPGHGCRCVRCHEALA